MMTVGELIKELQKFDQNMEVVVAEEITKDCITFTSEFDVDESPCFDPSVEGEEVWTVKICPSRASLFDDED